MTKDEELSEKFYENLLAKSVGYESGFYLVFEDEGNFNLGD
jgi:hypothetical protein